MPGEAVSLSASAFGWELPVNELPFALGLLELVCNKIVRGIRTGNCVSIGAFGIRRRFFLRKALRRVGVLVKDLTEASLQISAAGNV
jgi:hypothetical protein